MANRTDTTAITIHGTNPQNLIEKIVRMRIYANPYWKQHCFALDAASIVDKATEIDMYGGTYGALQKPTKFICLVLKLLQLQPEKDIIVEYIKNEDYRILGAFYMRLTGRPLDVYNYLEPLLNDFRVVNKKTTKGYSKTHIDELVDELLHSNFCCGIALPYLPKRTTLEQLKVIPARISALEGDEEDVIENNPKEIPVEQLQIQREVGLNAREPVQDMDAEEMQMLAEARIRLARFGRRERKTDKTRIRRLEAQRLAALQQKRRDRESKKRDAEEEPERIRKQSR